MYGAPAAKFHPRAQRGRQQAAEGDPTHVELDLILELLPVALRAEHRPDELSGGEQQRVAIARALVMRPRLVLADEPTGNLDSGTGAQIIALLRTLVAEQGVALLAVTHSEAVAGACDRVMDIRDGRLLSS